MKKIIGVFIIMVFAALAATMAFGEADYEYQRKYGVYVGNSWEALDLAETWCKNNGFDKWVNRDTSDTWLRFVGSIDAGGFEDTFDGLRFTPQNYKEKIFEYYPDMREFEMTEIGKIKGYTVWLIEGVSDSDIEDGYEKISIVGIICMNDD